MSSFKENLKSLHTEATIGQVELAKKLGVSSDIISLWENGLREPGMYSLIAIAKFFNVSLNFLVGLEVK